jgi:hypothetical protein
MRRLIVALGGRIERILSNEVFRKREGLTCSFSILFLFLGFFANYWRVADQRWFEYHQLDMESYIMGIMVKSRQDGILSSGGLTGLGSLNATPVQYSDGLSLISIWRT